MESKRRVISLLVDNQSGVLPSVTFPVASSTITMSSAVIPSYGTPEGLITIIPLSRSIAETLPHVNVTRLYFGSRRLASRTSCFNFSNILCTSLTSPPRIPQQVRACSSP